MDNIMTNTQEDESVSSITSEMSRNLRRSRLLEDHGTSTRQKDDLVNHILLAFSDPDRWPMTDEERCCLMKRWYRAALTIKKTEELGG